MSRKSKKKKHAGQQPGSPAAAFDSKISKAFEGVENLVIQRAADIEPKPIQWLWPNRIARGQLTLLAGDSGAGKSLLALDLAARVSTGAAWPDRPDEEQLPGNVLVFTAHDDPASIGRPRLERAGADLSRVFFVSGVDRQEDGKSTWKRQVSLPDDLMSLTKAIMAFRPIKLVVIDAAWVFCGRGSGKRSKRAGAARLAELAELAAMLQVAIVCVTDLRRDGHGEAVYRAAGDQALLAAAPTAWGVVRDPMKPALRLMLPLKSNYGPEQQALAFDIEDGRIVWESQAPEISPAAILAAEKVKRDSSGVGGWLEAILAAGPLPAKEIYRQGAECGYSIRLLQRIRPLVGVDTKRKGFEDGHWEWSLSGTQSGRAVQAEVAAAATAFENACGENVEGRKERGERNGAHAEARIFEEGVDSSRDLGGFCEDASMTVMATSGDDAGHLRDLGAVRGATRLDGVNWSHERACGERGENVEENVDRNGPHAEACIFEEGVDSSRDLGGFCEDARMAEVASLGAGQSIFEESACHREGEAPAEPPLCAQSR